MKKKSMWSILKRGLLLVVVLCLVIVLGVYFIDKYSPASAKFHNKYTDEYWQKREGFISYEQMSKETEKYNVTKDSYEKPYKDSDTQEAKINAARYEEELQRIQSPVITGLEKVNNQINELTKNLYQGTLEEWVLDSIGVNAKTSGKIDGYTVMKEQGYSGTAEEWKNLLLGTSDVSAFLEMQKQGYKETFDYWLTLLLEDANNETSAYSNAQAAGYTGTKLTWLMKVAGISQPEQLVAYEKMVEQGYKADVNAWKKLVSTLLTSGTLYSTAGLYDYTGTMLEFAIALYNDKGTVGVAIAYELATVLSAEDQETLKELNAEQSRLDLLKSLGTSRNLPKWDWYNQNVLLGFEKVLENDNYEFWLNMGLTTFKLVDKTTGKEWYSNPTEKDTAALPATQSLQKSIFILTYSKLGNSQNSYNAYDYSVSSLNETNGNVLVPNYSIKVDKEKNTVQVWYFLEKRGIDYTYFPYQISEEKVNLLLERNVELHNAGIKDSNGDVIPDIVKETWAYRKWIASYYRLIEATDRENKRGYSYYEFKGSHASMSQIVRRDLFLSMYEWCGYTEEDLAEDNLEFGQEIDLTKPQFSLAIEYSLSDSGLDVCIPGNSVNDNVQNKKAADFPVISIDILPYFTATKSGISGYTVIPDGSGAVLNHDNGNTNYSKYSKRVYSTDLANTKPVKTTSTSDLMFPMYAVINSGNQTGVLVEATQSAAQLNLTADVSGREDSYNKQYYTANLREGQEVIIGFSYYQTKLTKYTNEKVTEDICLNYTFLSEDELSYSAVAKKYRDRIVKRYDIKEKDVTDTPVLDMDVIGGYTYRDNFLGIGYTAKDSMTTLDQLSTMLDTYLGENIDYINVFYHGWRSGALVEETFKSIKFNSVLGSKKQLQQLVAQYKKQNVTLYPYVSLGEINKYQESFGKNHYTTRDVNGDFIVKYPYDLNSSVYNRKANPINILSPRFYQVFSQSLVDNYTKKMALDTLSIAQLGSKLSGDYKKGAAMFKTSAVEEQIASLQYAVDHGVTNINLYAPYDYAFPFITHAKDIPYQSTQYEILDYSIPFYQLVVNGLFDYSGESINANSEKGLNEHIMRILETGSNLSFTFTFDSSEKLLQTDYNTYYYTLYTEWLKEVKTAYEILNNLGISRCELVKHEVIQNNVFKVTYQNDHEIIEIVLNYTRVPVEVGGQNVAAKSYAVLNR